MTRKNNATARAGRREGIVAWIREQGLAQHELKAIQARLETDMPSVAGGWVPDFTTLHRWLKPFRSSRKAVAAAVAPSRLPTATRLALGSRAAALPAQAPRATLLQEIGHLAAEVERLRDELLACGALPDLLKRRAKFELTFTHKLDRGERGLRGRFPDDGVRRRYDELRAMTADLLAARSNVPIRQESVARRSLVNGAPSGLTLVADASNRVARTGKPSTMPFAVVRGEALAPDGSRLSDRGTGENAWGVTLNQIPRPQLGAFIPDPQGTKRRDDAMIRAILIAPVLLGHLTVREAARIWRRYFREQVTPTERNFLPDFPAELYSEARGRYHNINTSTLWRWRELATTTGGEAAGSAVAAVESLIHRYPKHATRATKLSANARAFIRRQFLGARENPTPAELAFDIMTTTKAPAATVAQSLREELGVDVSDRTVQRYIAREIAAAEQIAARGGLAAADVFRTRMIRSALYPNQVWIMDHSFFHREKVDVAHPEWVKRGANLVFPSAFVREVHSVGMQPQRRLVQKMSMSLIVDACSRRKLALRVWENTPSTFEALAALRDAVMRHGVPDVLYTDNGSDFTSRAFQAVLSALGIKSIKSLPYCPEGRGIVERDFQTIKTKILPYIPGFVRDPDSMRVADELLLDHATFQTRVWERVDRYMNDEKHAETGRIPREHFESEVGARAVIVPSLEATVALLSSFKCTTHSTGVHVAGGRYEGPGLLGIAHETDVVVHLDPYEHDVAHISVRGPDGQLQYNGPVQRYGQGGKPAPQLDKFLEMQAEWTEERNGMITVLARTAADKRRAAEATAEGAALGTDVAAQIQAAVTELAQNERAVGRPEVHLVPVDPDGSLSGFAPIAASENGQDATLETDASTSLLPMRPVRRAAPAPLPGRSVSPGTDVPATPLPRRKAAPREKPTRALYVPWDD